MAQFPTYGLLAAYSFSGNTNDVSGNGMHAVNYGAVPAVDRFGQANCCYTFTGSDSYIQTPVNSNIPSLTICAWFRSDTRSGSRSIVDSDSGNHFGHSLILGYFNGDNTMDIQYHNGWWDSQWPLNDSEWHQAVGVFVPGTVSLFMDGAFIGSESFTQQGYDGTNFRMGRHNPGEPRWFTGEIDDVLLYNRALTPSEIQDVYLATFEPPRPPLAPSNLTASAISPGKVRLEWSDNSDNESRFVVERRTPGEQWIRSDSVVRNATICIARNLHPLTAYEFRVQAVNYAVPSDYSNIASATTPAFPAPSDLQAQVLSSTDIALSWNDNSGAETRFDIEIEQSPGVWTAKDTAAANATSRTLTDLTPSTIYKIRVTAKEDNTPSPPSNAVLATTLSFSAPADLHATSIGPTGIELAWTDNTSDERYFVLERRSEFGSWYAIDSVSSNTTWIAVSGLQPATEYTFRVVAQKGRTKSSASNELTVRTRMILHAPNGFQVTVSSATEALLSWVDNATGESGYEIEERAPLKQWTLVHTTAANAGSYVRTGLTPDSTYYFRVRAVGNDAASDWTAETRVVLAFRPDEPRSLSAAALDYQSILLQWSRDSYNETNFQLERREQNGIWLTARTTGKGDTTVTDAGLKGSTTYAYRVRAINGAGESDWSNEASATTSSTPPPGNPFGLTAVATGPTSIRLAWLPGMPEIEAGFEIEESLTGNPNDFTPVKPDVGAGIHAYNRRGLTPETQYYYRVRAFNSGGPSAYSGIAGAVTHKASPIPPLAPSSITATTIDLTSIRIDWAIDDSIVVDHFELQQSPTDNSNDFITLQPDPSGADRSFTESGLMENTRYWYRLRAVNKFGISPWTDTTSAQTLKRVILPVLLTAMEKKDSIIALVEALLPRGDAKMDSLRMLLGGYAPGLDELPAKNLIATWRQLGVADGQKSAEAMDRYSVFESAVLDFCGSAVAQEVARQASLAPSISVKDLAALGQAWKGERPKASESMKPWFDAAMQNLALSIYDGTRTLNALAGLDDGAELADFYTGILTGHGEAPGTASTLFSSFTPYHKERTFARLFLPAVQPFIGTFADKAERLAIGGRTDSARAKVKRLTDAAKARVNDLASSFLSFGNLCTALDASYTLSTAAGPELKTFFRRVSLFKDGFLVPLGRVVEHSSIPATRTACLTSILEGLPADLYHAGLAAFDPESVPGVRQTEMSGNASFITKLGASAAADPAFAEDRALLAAVRARLLAVDTAAIHGMLGDIHAGGLSVIAAIDRLQRPLVAIEPADILADNAFAAVYYPAVGLSQRAKTIRAALMIPLLDYRLDPLPARQTATAAEIDSVLAVVDRAQLALADARAAAGPRLAVPAPVLDSVVLESPGDGWPYQLNVYIRNAGGAPIASCDVRITPLDAGVLLADTSTITSTAIVAGGTELLKVNNSIPAGIVRTGFAVKISIPNGATYVDLCFPKVPPPLTVVENLRALPVDVTLSRNYPNPFNPSTTITYGIPKDGHVLLRVFDVHGRVVTELVNENKPAGMYTIDFNGSNLPSGVYLYRLEAEGQVRTSTMTLMK